jgi:hypothetical protein
LGLAYALITVEQDKIDGIVELLVKFPNPVEVRIVLTDDEKPVKKILFKYRIESILCGLEVLARIRQMAVLNVASSFEWPKTPEEFKQMWSVRE